ncbi:MAG: EamA family transporter [Rhodobacterales bacterium]|nr:MAG: EamA family transporter [Rhodobacterales bacterium]
MTQQSLSPRAWSELFLLAAIWGGIFLAARLALDEIGPLWAVAQRTFWAMIVLWGAVIAMRLPVTLTPRAAIGFLGMGLLNNLIPFGLLNWSQLHIESGLASIFNASTAIFGVVVAALLLPDERLGMRKAAGVLIGFAGVVTAIGLSNLGGLDPRNLAQWAAVLATLSYAFAGVWARRMLAGHPPQVAAAGMLTASAAMALPLAFWAEGPPRLALTLTTWGAIAYMAVVGTALAYLLYYRVLAMAGSGNLMLVTLLIPPFAIALGALVLGESLPPRALTGFGLLALGLLIINGRALRRRHH